MAKVAVITRTKDRPLFLKRAIGSVSAQTYGDYVHVIVNDGGNQKEVQSVIDSFDAEVTKRIKLFHRDTASGAPDSIFNECIDRVESEYVAIHDDDDTWHSEFLAQTVAELDRGAKGVVVPTDNVYEEVAGNTIKQKKMTPYMPDLRAISLYYQCLDNQLTALAFVYRRDAYVEVGKYDSTLPVAGDWEFGIRFLMKYDVEYINPGFALAYYHRRLNADNSFAQHDHRKYITKILNKYLRQELSEGKLGVGYIMNSLRYEEDRMTSIAKRLLPGPVTKLIRRKVR